LCIRLFLKPCLYFNILSISWQLLLSVKWRHLFPWQIKTRPTQFWKWSFSNILLVYLDVVWFGRWPEPWNFKTSHFRILYSFPSRRPISALFLFSTETDDAILLTTKVARKSSVYYNTSMALKTILCTKKYLTSHSLKIPIVIWMKG
jgi:hypothetical protein